MNYEKLFKDIVETHITRDGIKELMEYLDHTDFYTAPASTRFHDSEKGGLVKHSVKVFNALVDLVGDTYPMETVALVSLFHDICKTNYYTTSTRNVKNEKGQWESVPYYSVNDMLPVGHGEKSIILLMSVPVKLSIAEVFAIRWHMGGFVPKEDYSAMSEAYTKCTLAVLLHLADMKATYLD